jgi:outer membrane protein TolC
MAEAMERYRLLTGQRELPSPLAEPALPGADLPPHHPGLLVAEASVGQARAERQRSRSERRANPTLSVGGKHWRDDRGADDQDALQLEVSLPFGLGSQAAPRVASAERAYTDSEAERVRVRRELDEALGLARTVFEGTHAALTVAGRRQALASEALTQVERGFELGEIDLNTLLRARQNAREAQLGLELKRLEQGRAAARLNQALGVVPQ